MEFKRYRAGKDVVSAKDLNRRAEEQEKLMRISVAPPLEMRVNSTGYHLSLKPSSRLGRQVIGRITFCSKLRASQIGFPSTIIYNATSVEGEEVTLTGVFPRYGRPVFGDEGMIHPSAVGDACRLIYDDPAGDGTNADWVLEVMNEQIAGGPCGSPAPVNALSSDGPHTEISPSSRNLFSQLTTRLRLAATILQKGLLVPTVKEPFTKTFVLSASTAGTVSEAFDISKYPIGSLSFQKIEGTLGTPTLVVESTLGAGAWQQIPNNEDSEAATFTTLANKELRNLKLKGQKWLRIRVSGAGGSGLKYLVTFHYDPSMET